MSIFDSPRFLRNVLFADAASCVASGALQVLFTASLAELLNLPDALLAGSGWFLLAYGVFVGVVASRDAIPRTFVLLFIAGNLAWAAACAALVAGAWLAPAAPGTAWVLAQAFAVVALAFLQWNALRAGRAAGRPDAVAGLRG